MLAGRAALVTGAAQGIGKAVAVALAGAGAAVVLADLPGQRERAEAVVAEIVGAGGRALFHECDVCSRAQVDSAVQAAVGRFGSLDIVVANASRSIRRPFLELTEEQFDATVQVTQYGVFRTVQAAAVQMRRQGRGGRVVVVSSIMGRDVLDAVSSTYSMCKAGLIHWSRCLAGELAPSRITVNCICPGWIDTEGERVFADDSVIRAISPKMPFGRLGSPDDIANAALFFASPQSGYVSGAVVDVDGAYRSSTRLPCCLETMAPAKM